MSEQPPVATEVLDRTLQSAEDVNARRAMLAQLQEQQRVDAQFNQMVAPLQQEQQAAVDTQFNAQVGPMQQTAANVVQSDFAKWEAELQASTSTGGIEPAKAVAPAATAPEQTSQIGLGKVQEATLEPAKAFAPSPAVTPVPSIPEKPVPDILEQPTPRVLEQPLPASPEQPSPQAPVTQPEAPAQTVSTPEVPVPKATETTPKEPAVEKTTDDQENTPTSPEDEAEPFDASKLTIGVVDISSGVDSHKRDAAAERLDRETTGGFKAIIRKIWKGNLWRDYTQLKYQRDAQAKILADGGNLYAAQGGTQEDHARASRAIVDRFVGNFLNHDSELLAAGETTGSMGDIGKHEGSKEPSEGSKLEANLRQAIGEFAEGKMSLRELEEYKKITLESFGEMVKFEDAKKGLLFADNIVEVAKNAKAAFDHGLGISNVEERLAHIKDMITIGRGDARIGVRTEGKQNTAEKIVDWMQNHRSTRWINETSAGIIVGGVAAAANISAKSALGIISRIGLLGAPSAIIAGAREYNQIKKDRISHMRSMAEGGESVLRNGKRRIGLERTRYETQDAGQLTQTLEASIANMGDTSAGLRSTVDILTQIKARIEKSDKDGIDLISFSSKESVEGERRDLLLKMAEARVAVKKALTSMSDEDLARAGMVGPDDVPIRDITTLLQARTANVTAALESEGGDIAARDEAFRTLRRNRVIMMAVAGYGTGLVTGIVMQEAKAALSGSVQGVLETRGESNSRTLLATIFRRDGDTIPSSLKPGAVGENLANVNGHTAVKVPPGFNLQGENGSWSLADSSGNKVVDNVGFDGNGQFDAATQQELTAKGFSFASQEQTIAGANPDIKPEVTTTTVTASPEDYIANHKADFTQVSRNEWLGNDTPLPDHNEDDIWWGGVDNTGIDENGNYVFNMAHMTADGSWNQGASVNAQQLIADGKMKIALSINKDNLSNVIMIDVDQNGNAVIPKDSFAGKTLFTTEGGQARYVGGYAEAVQLGDVKDGVRSINMLATVVGDNEISTVQDTVPQVTLPPDTHSVMVNTLTKVDLVEGTPGLETEIPPIIPVTPRSGLERTDRPPRSEETEPEPAPFSPEVLGDLETSRQPSAGMGRIDSLRNWVQAEPGRLQSRRQVTDSQGRISWVEADGSPVERSVERERLAIHNYMDRLSQKDPEYVAGVELIANEMTPMNTATRVAVNIPVWNGTTNLSTVLSQYVSQTDVDGVTPLAPSTYEVNVLITRETGTQPSGAMLSARRFMDEFENTNGYRAPINLYEVEIDAPDHTPGYARKLLNDVVASRSIARPEQSGTLYMESEDDTSVTRVDKKMVINALNKLDQNPELDAVSGTIDRASNRVANNDMLLLRRRADDFLGILASQKQFRNPKAPEWNAAWNRIPTHDSNTAFSAEAYALIDGDQAADVDGGASMGEKIAMVRGDGQTPNLEVVGKVPTRSDAEAIDGVPDNPDLARIAPENQAAFAQFLQQELERVKEATPSVAVADQLTRRMMFWLGFKAADYVLQNGNLEVANWDNVRTTLTGYRTRNSRISLT